MLCKLWAVIAYTLGIALAGIAIGLAEVSRSINSAAEACVRGAERLGGHAGRMARS